MTVPAPVRINGRASASTRSCSPKITGGALEHAVSPGAAQDAVCRGTFQNNPGGGLRSVVLQTALEIASAMAFLHSHGIVHGVRLHSRAVPAVRRQRTPGAICTPAPCKTVHRASCVACARACRSRWIESIYLANDLFIRELTPCREGCPCRCLYDYSSLTPHTLCALQDLTGGNVLLTSSPNNAHGFCAKIADFGAACLLSPCLSTPQIVLSALDMHIRPSHCLRCTLEIEESGTDSQRLDILYVGLPRCGLHEVRMTCARRALAPDGELQQRGHKHVWHADPHATRGCALACALNPPLA